MKFKEEYEITSHDIDVNNNIKPSFLIRYMQETANHQMRDRKPTYLDFFNRGMTFIVTRMTVEIYAQLHQYEHIEVATWSCPPKGATLIRCYEIKRGDELVAQAYSTWTVVNMNTGKLCKSSEIDLSNYESEEPLEMDLPTRVRLPKDIEYEKMTTKEVVYSECDMNLHMNNTNYPDMLWNYIPDVRNKKVTSVNLRFMKEAALGAKLDIYRGRLPEPVEGDKDATEMYCFASRIDGETNVEATFGLAPL